MARDPGDEKPGAGQAAPGNELSGGLLPDLVRRALALGLSGFFFTEEAIRKAVGDTLPREWMDFAVDQSERTRKEFLERLSYELAQSLEKVDVAAVLRELLEGRTLEVRAQIRLGDRTEQSLHVQLEPDEGEG